MTFVWIALVTTVACAAQSAEPAPIANTPATSELAIAAPASVPAVARPERVHFDANAVRMSASEAAVLDAVIQRLHADAALNLQISGHADASEIDANNTGTVGLSHARADAVRSQLIARGIDGRRLVIRAVGATEPRDTNATSSGRTANRRVEFEPATITVRPFKGRVVVTDTIVEILDPVSFESRFRRALASAW